MQEFGILATIQALNIIFGWNNVTFFMANKTRERRESLEQWSN